MAKAVGRHEPLAKKRAGAAGSIQSKKLFVT